MKGLFKGLGVTFKAMTAPKVTTSYPDVPFVMPDRFRGIQHFEPDKCIVCNQCARVCPTECITLTGKANPDPDKKGKVIDTYDINFEICISMRPVYGGLSDGGYCHDEQLRAGRLQPG